jgi:F-type H+-transporting ATPase subunit delta
MKYSRTDIARGFVIQAKKNPKNAVKELAALILELRLHGDIDEILADIANEYQAQYGIIEAEVKTAFALSGALKKQIEDRIKQETGSKTVKLHEVIDKTLLGGVVINAPDMDLDLSLRSKLNSIRGKV